MPRASELGIPFGRALAEKDRNKDGRIRRQAGIFQRAEDRTAPALNQSWTHLPKLGPLPGLFLFACSKFPGFAHVYLESFIADLIEFDTNPPA